MLNKQWHYPPYKPERPKIDWFALLGDVVDNAHEPGESWRIPEEG